MIEAFLERSGPQITVHRRKNGRNQYATEPRHMPDRLNAVRDIREPDYGDILLERARGIGPNAVAWAERCFASRDFPEQAFATVQGMIRLADDHGGAPRRAVRRGSRSGAPLVGVRIPTDLTADSYFT